MQDMIDLAGFVSISYIRKQKSFDGIFTSFF